MNSLKKFLTERGKRSFYKALTPAIELLVRSYLSAPYESGSAGKPLLTEALTGHWHPCISFSEELHRDLTSVLTFLDHFSPLPNMPAAFQPARDEWHKKHRAKLRELYHKRIIGLGGPKNATDFVHDLPRQLSGGLNNLALFTTYSLWSRNVEEGGIEPYQQVQLLMSVHINSEREIREKTGVVDTKIKSEQYEIMRVITFKHMPYAAAFAHPEKRSLLLQSLGRGRSLGCPFHRARTYTGSSLTRAFLGYAQQRFDLLVTPYLHENRNSLHPDFIAGANSRIRDVIEKGYTPKTSQ